MAGLFKVCKEVCAGETGVMQASVSVLMSTTHRPFPEGAPR